jgi:hypothetical protein
MGGAVASKRTVHLLQIGQSLLDLCNPVAFLAVLLFERIAWELFLFCLFVCLLFVFMARTRLFFTSASELN